MRSIARALPIPEALSATRGKALVVLALTIALALGGCAAGETDTIASSQAGGDPRGASASGSGAGSGGAGAGGAGGAGGEAGEGGAGDAGGGGAGGGAQRYLYACSDVYLFRIDVATLGPNVVVEKVGEFGVAPDRMIDIAVAQDGKIFGMSWSEGAAPNKLWAIDPETANPTYIAEVPGAANVALTFDVSGALLGADKGGRLFQIDPATAVTTEIGAGNGFGSAGDLVGVANGTLYGFSDAGGSASEAVNSLVTIDPATGASTEVGLTGFANLWGAAFWCGKVYAFGSDGDIIEIDIKTGAGTLIASKIPAAKSGFYGAGVTPLSPLAPVGSGCN